MKPSDYVIAHKITLVQLARYMAVEYSTVYRMFNEHRKPSALLLAAFEKMSGGLVTASGGLCYACAAPASKGGLCVRHYEKRVNRLPQGEWTTLCERFGNYCLRCGSSSDALTRDHVNPAGPDTSDNLQPLCCPCNSQKGAKCIDYRQQEYGPFRRMLTA